METKLKDDFESLLDYCMGNAEEESFVDCIIENGCEALTQEETVELAELYGVRYEDDTCTRFMQLLDKVIESGHGHIFACASRISRARNKGEFG